MKRQEHLFGFGLGLGVLLGLVLGSILADRMGREALDAIRSLAGRIQRRDSGVRFEALVQ